MEEGGRKIPPKLPVARLQPGSTGRRPATRHHRTSHLITSGRPSARIPQTPSAPNPPSLRLVRGKRATTTQLCLESFTYFRMFGGWCEFWGFSWGKKVVLFYVFFKAPARINDEEIFFFSHLLMVECSRRHPIRWQKLRKVFPDAVNNSRSRRSAAHRKMFDRTVFP